MSAWFLTRVKTVIHVSVVCFSLLCLLPALSVAAQVTMEWDLNDPTPEGYRIYQRTEGQDYDYNQPVWTGTENTCTINGLDDYINYYFVVRAYTGSNESTDSNEITFLSSPHQDTTYTISVLAGDNGSILPSNTVAVNSGDDKTFTISAETGYDVSKVIVDGANVGTVSSYTFGQVAANHTISAVFSINSYTIAASTGTNGSIFPVGNVSVAYGGEQAFTITPDDGYHVSDVKVDGISKGQLSTFTFSQVAANRSIAVSFSKDTFTIPDTAEVTLKWDPTNPAPDNYAIYQRAEEQTYDYSQPCWTGTGTSGIVYNLDFDTTYYFVVRAQVGALQSTDSNEITYRAASTPTATYTISASAGANGSVTPSGSISVEHGDGRAYAVLADVGHHVSDVKVDGVSIGAVTAYTFANVTADHTINATFATDTYTISASADANGSVTPTGVVDIAHGGNQVYIFKADQGFHVEDVQVDGKSIGAVGNYTFTDIIDDHTLLVSFSENTLFKIWIEAEDGDLQWPMEIADDESASTGGYVWVSEGTGNFAVPSETAGSAEYHFEVSESGDYAIWGRQISANTSSDSFFVSIDGLTEIVWHTKPGGPENWTWDVVSIRNAEDPDYGATPETFKLMPGSHTLEIRQREDGTKLDRILITNQTDLTDPEPNTVMDTMVFGDVQMDHNWVRIDFEKPFVNPVVVAGPISLNGGHPAVVRIRNVDPTGFEMRIQEWGYLDGSHMTETVSYIVVEEGNYTLDDGTKIAAAVLDTSAVAAFQQIIFDEQFNVAPVVMTTLTSFNESDAVTGRLKQITTDSFSYRMQEQELNANTHVTERLDYIAWEPSSGERGGITYRVGHSADAVKHKNYTISFDKPFASSPALLAGMQTTDGGDTANVRYSSKDGVSVDVLVDEEQSRDTETNHTTEIVGYMAFTR